MEIWNMYIKVEIRCLLVCISVVCIQVYALNTEGINLPGNDLCKAECHQDSCVLDCDNLNLSSIPTCDMISINCSLVTELRLRNNKIRNLPPAGFANFTNLWILDLSENPLETCTNSSFVGLNKVSVLIMTSILPQTAYLIIDNGAFSPLTSLKVLNLAASSVQLPNLFLTFCSLSKNIDSIYLDRIRFSLYFITIDDTSLKCFDNLKLKRLSMDESHIVKITFKAWLKLGSLNYLSLKGNKINMDTTVGLGVAALHNLTYLDLSCLSTPVCDDIYSWSDWLPGEPNMFKENNTIISYAASTSVATYNTSKMINVFMYRNLQTLLLRHTYVSFTFTHQLFCWMNNRILNLDLSFIKHISIYGSIPCAQHLKYLNLRGVRWLQLDMEVFHEMSSLEILLLGSAGITVDIFMKNNPYSIFDKNLQLKFLDLSNLGLASLHKNIFRHLRKLATLILSHNRLTEVDNLLANLSAIKHIDLSYNDFRDIPLSIIVEMEKTFKNRTDKKFVNLSNNPFICVCSNINKLHKVLHSKLVIHDVHSANGSLRCTLSNREQVSFIKAYERLNLECRKLDMISIIFITVLYPITLGVTFLLTCCFRFSLTVKYLWYNLGNWMNGRQVHNEKENFTFDAFIAHSSREEEWVRNNLIRKLEHRQRPYSLCVHYRSFLPGETITDNIISAITRSKTTILVVSKAFIRSGWCDFESRVAQAQYLENANHKVIAILFPGVYKYARKKPSLKTLLDNVTALEWPEDDEGLDVFWLRLCYALGRPLDIPNDNNYILRPIDAL